MVKFPMHMSIHRDELGALGVRFAVCAGSGVSCVRVATEVGGDFAVLKYGPKQNRQGEVSVESEGGHRPADERHPNAVGADLETLLLEG